MADLPLLCEERELDLWQAWCESCGISLNNPRHVISDANVRVQAAIDGQGLILADELMQTEMETGLLVAPFDEQLHGYGYALLIFTTRATNQNVTAFRDWLVNSQ